MNKFKKILPSLFPYNENAAQYFDWIILLANAHEVQVAKSKNWVSRFGPYNSIIKMTKNLNFYFFAAIFGTRFAITALSLPTVLALAKDGDVFWRQSLIIVGFGIMIIR